MRELGPFKAAIEGDDTELRNVAGPDAIIRVAPELSSALVVRPTTEGKQAGTVAILHEGGGSTVARFGVPRSFRVTAIDRDGAEFMWARTAEEDETDEDRDEFLEVARPTSLVIYVSGDFAVHYEETTEIYAMDGYWLAVQFTADRTPVIHYVDA